MISNAAAAPVPESALSRIVFVSTATEALSLRRARKLISAATRNNRALEVTGLLLYANERFMGTLEGPESAVRLIFERVQNDYRHKNVDMLRFEPITERLFDDWRVSLRNFAVDSATLPALSPFMSADFDTSEYLEAPNEVYRAMIAFRNAHTGTQPAR